MYSKAAQSRERERNELAGYKVLLTTGIIFTITMLWVALEDYRFYKTYQTSRTWPIMTGVVNASSVETSYADGEKHITHVSYVYHVSGGEYTCNIRPKFYGRLEDAEMFLKALPVGIKIQVSYNPAKPQDCMSVYDEPEFPSGATKLIIIGIIIIIFSFLMISHKKGYSISHYLNLVYTRLKANP